MVIGKSDGPDNAQLADLLQDLLDLVVQRALGILLARVGIEMLLNLRHAAVGLGAEFELDLDQSLEAWVEIGDAQIDELRELGRELLVELLVGGFGHLRLFLGTRELGGVLVGLLDEFLDLGTHGVVVEELVVTLLNACKSVSFALHLA